jgi:putative intracellular protease/amidase
MPGLQRRPRRRCRRFLWAIGSVLLSALTFAGMFVAGALVTAHGLHNASPAAVPRTRRPTTMSRPRPATSLGRTVAGSSWHSSPEKRGPSPAPCSHPSTSSRALPLSTRTSSPLTPAPCLWKAARLLVPTYTFADVDADPVLRPDLVVVPALSKPPDGTEKALRTWVTTQHHDGARVLGVCAGSVVLGRTGVLDGMHATSHWSRITALRHGRPAVRWVTGRRWVGDGSAMGRRGFRHHHGRCHLRRSSRTPPRRRACRDHRGAKSRAPARDQLSIGDIRGQSDLRMPRNAVRRPSTSRRSSRTVRSRGCPNQPPRGLQARVG